MTETVKKEDYIVFRKPGGFGTQSPLPGHIEEAGTLGPLSSEVLINFIPTSFFKVNAVLRTKRGVQEPPKSGN